MSHYNLKLKIINNLVDVKFENTNYYQYKNIHFYYKKINNNNESIIVSFHGSLTQHKIIKNQLTDLPIFRGYNWNYNILCLSDKLLEDFENYKLRFSWFLSVNKKYEFIYIEIIKYICKNYKKIIFVGSSAGGFPALYYASLFNQYAIISNPQIYINNTNYINTLLDITKFNLDELNIDINTFLLNNKPKLIYYYQNINDTRHYENHAKPFELYLKKTNNNLIKIIYFIGEKTSPYLTYHDIRFPNNYDWDFIISNFIYNLI